MTMTSDYRAGKGQGGWVVKDTAGGFWRSNPSSHQHEAPTRTAAPSPFACVQGSLKPLVPLGAGAGQGEGQIFLRVAEASLTKAVPLSVGSLVSAVPFPTVRASVTWAPGRRAKDLAANQGLPTRCALRGPSGCAGFSRPAGRVPGRTCGHRVLRRAHAPTWVPCVFWAVS